MRDIPSGVPVFYSGSSNASHETGQVDAGRGVRARKRVHPVQVRFADAVSDVQTLEGIVRAKRGDAIVTGLFGERWPVGRDSFSEKYQALSPVEMGAPGSYLSLPIKVTARLMDTPFDVVLADGNCRLHGQAGDWLVDYGNGNLGIVNAAVFDATYEILEGN